MPPAPPVVAVLAGTEGDRIGSDCYLSRSALDPWCSGQTCQPVTLEIAGSNPVGSAITVTARTEPRPLPGRGSLMFRPGEPALGKPREEVGLRQRRRDPRVAQDER